MRDGQTTEEKVRLLGVNTPESVDPRRAVECFGKEASRFLQSLIEGKRVRLEPDLEADEIDKYGRLLRKVIGENGVDINAHLIEQGYAYAYVTFPMNKMRRTYLKNLQSKAEQTAVGLWNPSTCDGQK
ncbi:thermonuclease family protein [Candidatus Uhrbacteria bacterium]|nr:thermonuclease family protein [Candidatus Uhrbacteria bacterium]